MSDAYLRALAADAIFDAFPALIAERDRLAERVAVMREALSEIQRQFALCEMSRSDVDGLDPEITLGLIGDIAAEALAATEERAAA